MTMLIDDVEAIHRIRLKVREFMLVEFPTMPYSFDTMSGRDYSDNPVAGNLFKQNADFALFDPQIDTTRRAGPSKVSPTRCWGTLVIELYTKETDSDLDYQRRLRVFSAWFAEQTVADIRFRTFTPLSTSRVMGFLNFSGVLSFEFEIQPKDMTL